MAYSDYGAFVYLNGVRMESNEDCSWNGHSAHGLIADGDMHIICYKQGLPRIFYKNKEIEYYDCNKIDEYDFTPFHYELDGYKFYFDNYNKPYVVEMKCPNGDEWRCEYDYWYGAGFYD